jgi:hypothetical protein
MPSRCGRRTLPAGDLPVPGKQLRRRKGSSPGLTQILGLDPFLGKAQDVMQAAIYGPGDHVKLVTIGIDDHTDGVNDCPKIMDDADADDGPIYVQGWSVTETGAVAQAMPGPGEVLCAVPRQAFMRAARRILGE